MSRRAWIWLAVGVVVVVTGALVYAWSTPVDRSSVAAEGLQLRADFGLRETPITRFFDVDVCSLRRREVFDECTPGSGSGSLPAPTADPTPARTEISSAAVIADLAEVDPDAPLDEQGRCDVKHTGSQFPASQFKTTVENRGSRGLAITLTGDPSEPETVDPGTYCGAVVVQLETGEYARVGLAATVSDRGQGGLRFRVALALLLGALAGGLVKWLGDRYSPVAGLRRRQRRLLRRLGGVLAHLPERVRDDFETIRDGIAHFDPDGLDPLLTAIETDGTNLARFGSAMLDVDEWLAHLSPLAGSPLSPDLGVLLQLAIERQTALAGAAYPWSDPDAQCAAAERLRASLRALARAIEAADDRAYTHAARSLFPDDAAFAAVVEQQRSTGRQAVRYTRMADVVRAQPAPPRRSPQQVILDNVLPITMVATAVVVMIIGYKTQFLDDKAFDGGNGDYLALFLWAFALQVAGVTVGEVVGKLTRGASAGAPAPSSPG